jgi:5'-nucleotidase
MRIAITNDDGIQGEGLLRLVQWASRLGEVWVFAPKVEQSAKSHGIEIRQAFEVKKLELEDVEAYTVDSTPADCVRFAVLGLGKEFDLVLSGINRGLNLGLDIMYSGTVSAVMEADAMGIPAIALSAPPKHYIDAIGDLDTVVSFFRENRLMEQCSIYNVNIPAGHKGIRITCQGGRYYSDEYHAQGQDLYLPKGVDVFTDCGCYDQDTDAVLHGNFISIMPLNNNKANMEVYRELTRLNP